MVACGTPGPVSADTADQGKVLDAVSPQEEMLVQTDATLKMSLRAISQGSRASGRKVIIAAMG